MRNGHCTFINSYIKETAWYDSDCPGCSVKHKQIYSTRFLSTSREMCRPPKTQQHHACGLTTRHAGQTDKSIPRLPPHLRRSPDGNNLLGPHQRGVVSSGPKSCPNAQAFLVIRRSTERREKKSKGNITRWYLGRRNQPPSPPAQRIERTRHGI